MTTKQLILAILLGVFMIGGAFTIGLFIGDYLKLAEQEEIIPTEEEEIMRPTTIEKISEPQMNNETGEIEIEKQFIHGNTVINYTVGIENGVEETPPPDVLLAMQASYSAYERDEQRRIIAQAVKDGPQGIGKIIGIQTKDGEDIYVDINVAYKNTMIHVNNKLKKEYLDANFSCDNFHSLAKRFKGESMYGVGYAGSVENYIYGRAFNECLYPKYQEDLAKVLHELEEVNATSVEDVNVYD